MRNQFFDHNFLFDFYSVRGSTGTPSDRSNVRWCALRKFLTTNGEVQFWSFFPSLIVHGTKSRRAAVLIFGTVVKHRTLYSN